MLRIVLSVAVALAACDSKPAASSDGAILQCAPPPPFERIDAIVSVPLCGTRLFVPQRWVRDGLVRYGCDAPDAPQAREDRIRAALGTGEMCRPRDGLINIEVPAFGPSSHGSYDLRFGSPEFDRDLPHKIFIKRNRSVADERTLAIFRSDVIAWLQNPRPAGDGYLTDGYGTYVLIEPKYRRPNDVALMVFCDRDADAARQICRAYINLRSYRVGYDFVAARFPRARWEELDQHVIALMTVLARLDQP